MPLAGTEGRGADQPLPGRLEIRVLGSVDALVDGHALPLGGSKRRSVLAMLALRANTTVSSDELIDGLWGEHPPRTAGKNVQLYISGLRKAFADAHSEAEILTRGRGYELRLPQDAVDAARFERLVEEAARDGGRANGAARVALELWRGAPLPDVADEPFAGPEIRRLEELHLRAIELTLDAELAAGRHGEVTGELEALVAAHPLRERFQAQRMLALYRAGRQSEALEAYRQARERLVDEIGVEPGPELQRLHAAILAQDPSLDLVAPIEELPLELEGGSPLLAGRERELRWLRRRWDEARSGRARLALLSGPRGIGKTRLAAELAGEAQRAGAGVLYAAGAGAPSTALDAVDSAADSERPTLLVLDDADDASPGVLEAAAHQAREPRTRPLLVLVIHRDEQPPPAFAGLLETGAGQRLTLDRLRAEATAEIAELYAPVGGVAMPLQTLLVESEGVPRRVHRAASEWARADAAERLVTTVGRAATERGGLRTAEAELAGNVVDLQAVRERTRLYLVEEPPDPAPTVVCPFRGLAPFDAAHADYFFGRERLVAELVARLVGSTLLAVVGPSGSGKSSAVRAGLLPALGGGVLPASEGWRQVLLRPGEHPLAELSRALSRSVPGTTDGEEGDRPMAALARLPSDQRLVLAVDQLEEVFTACRDEDERAAFLGALVEAACDRDERVILVLAVRADFYGRCAEHADLSTLMSANHVLVGPMRRDELRRAVELPVRRAVLRVEPRLVSALIAEVAGEPGGLPLLSTALLELWQRREGRTLRYEAYERSGGVRGAVARLAEDAYQRLSEPQRERARAMLLRLTGAEDESAFVRRRVPLEELDADRDELAAAALAVLTESRLLTVDEGAVEVAHEALLREWPRLRRWLEEDAEGRRLHHHVIHASREWQAADRDPAELYRGARLSSALDWGALHGPELNELERAFLDESRAASEREAEGQRRVNRRLRALLVGVGGLLLLAVIAGIVALSERGTARDVAVAADAQRLGAEALTEDRLDRALRLAAAGPALDDTAVTRSNLLSTLLRSPAALGVLNGDGDPLISSALSPDGRTLAVGDRGGTVMLFDTETREPIGDHQAPGPVWVMEFAPRSAALALVATVGTNEVTGDVGALQVLDAGTARVRGSVSLGRHPSATGPGLDYFNSVNYAPDGRSLIVSYSGGDINRSTPMFLRRYDAHSAEPLGKAVRVAPRSASTPPRLSPDGRLIVATDEATYAIDAETLRVIRRYPVGALSAALSPDGSTLAIHAVDGGLRLLDLASGRLRTLAGRQDQSLAGAPIGVFSPDGRTLSTSEDNGDVILRDARTGDAIEALAGHGDEVWSHAFSPDGHTLYTASEDGSAIAWDVAGDRRLGRPFSAGFVYESGDPFPPAFAISPDGQTLAVARLDGRVDLVDAETLRRTGRFEAFPHRAALAVEYSADGRRLAVAGAGGGVGVWDAGSGKRIAPLLRPPRGPRLANRHTVQALAFGQGNLLAAAEVGGAVRIWDVERRQLLRPPMRLAPFVLGLAFSPDGSQLAIAFGAQRADGSDGVEVRDVGTGEPLARLPSNGEVRSLAFSPDGRMLAGGEVDGSALLWATHGWRQVGRPLALRTASALGIAFSPDARTLATSHADGTVVLWDVESEEPIGSPLPGMAAAWGIDTWVTARFAPDGARLFVVSDVGRAIRWEVDPSAWRQHACTVAGGGLTPEQWEEVVPEQDYRPICPSG
jgi:DNA-binding SARP family transcriptional activator/WD40 repeat protein